MSPYGKQFFKQHTEYILANLGGLNEISDYVNEVLSKVQDDIKLLVDTNNHSELIRKYHK